MMALKTIKVDTFLLDCLLRSQPPVVSSLRSTHKLEMGSLAQWANRIAISSADTLSS